ncbi:flagellar protein FliT [Thiorhodospira sibirica]|uniref:flagellar protein FliT n=1 Tax=Thiorhodospira sibirica TaxID=154347 RepID=UPI00022C0AD7|nr:flagellar protein FliT [Thiorhodospira sibirica]
MKRPIETAQKALQAAKSKDWETVSQLDAQCRSEVDQLVKEATSMEMAQEAQRSLAQIHALYQQITELAEADRQAVADERKNIVKSRSGALSYLEAKVRGEQEH